MNYPIIMNGDHADFERGMASVPNEERADWPLPSFDALDWARAFVKAAAGNPAIPVDEGAMLSWFAGALMRGYDEAVARLSAEPPPHE